MNAYIKSELQEQIAIFLKCASWKEVLEKYDTSEIEQEFNVPKNGNNLVINRINILNRSFISLRLFDHIANNVFKIVALFNLTLVKVQSTSIIATCAIEDVFCETYIVLLDEEENFTVYKM